PQDTTLRLLRASPSLSLDRFSMGNLHKQHKFVCQTITHSQHRLLAHSDRNIIVSVIFSYESHHRPVLLRVIGVKCDELISAVLIEAVHSDGVLQGISKEKHLHLHWKQQILV
uniref:Uncharacterized protein n=1 Tax=Zonotrichia albicollis TaxID=44394 RepID=A0A8D2NM04_ZONAL